MRACWNTSSLVLAAISLSLPAGAHELSAPPPGTPALAPAARAAAAVTDTFHAALASGDVAAAKALIADDALIFESGGVERSKAEYAAHHLGADAKFAAATRRTITRRTGYAGPDQAWIATESKVSGSFEARSIDSVSTETMVLRRERGGWRIAHIHWSSATVR